MLTVTLYSGNNCHLCEQVEEDLESLQDRYPHHVVVINIDDDDDLQAKYRLKIPVVEIGPYRLEAPIERRELAMTLGAASDRKRHLEDVGDKVYHQRVKRGKNISKTDRFAGWFANHYMLVFNLFVFLYVGLPFLAPVMQRAGATAPAAAIYRVYGGLCHQLSYRSWFIFGDQPIYPRAAAGLERYTTFQEATGLNENALVPAREFIGNEKVGYKIALCQRDVAIYGAILLFGILFSLTGRKWKPLPVLLWFLIGLVPIALDGGSQLVGMFVSSFEGEFWRGVATIFPPRESTPLLRTITGFLFGFTTAWFGYPLVEETMVETRLLLTKKLAHVKEAAITKEKF